MRIAAGVAQALLVAGAALTGACSVDHDAPTGTIVVNLVGQAPSGTLYRLRDATITVTGPSNTQVFHTEDDPDQTQLSADVAAGDYSAALADGWHLERVIGSRTVVVDAQLESPNPIQFTVQPQQRTIVPLRFRVDLGDVDMAQGYDIVLTIDEVGGRATLAPLAPTAAHHMYQGGQQQFRTSGGQTCSGRVAASMGEQGFCYLDASDEVRCAGLIGPTDFGTSFAPTGQHGASQIMVMFAVNAGMCVTATDHTVRCMGNSTTNPFGDALTSTFSRWTDHTDVAAIATGTWDQVCGITLAGQVFCEGFDIGHPAIDIGAPGQTSLWVDTFGTPHLSDQDVLRSSESRTQCRIGAHGMLCEGQSFGPTDGSIVMGLEMEGQFAFNNACWLTEDATVTCTFGPRFAPGKVLYLAADFYSDSLCAIYRDGSVWCIGPNQHGKLGTGNTDPLAVETMVAPPGSARVGCDP